jgi:outer membrane receptor protein involved in Fe transport
VQTDGRAFVVAGPASPNSVKARFPDNSHARTTGVFLSDAWQLSPALQLEPSLRYDLSRTHLAQGDRIAGGDFASEDVSASLGLLYRLGPRLSFTANAGKAYRAPNINDLAQTGRRSGSPPRITISNPSLQPETLQSADVGLRWSGPRLQAELSVFHSRYADRITTLPTGASLAAGSGACPSGNTACVEVQNRNIAQARYSGVESGLRVQLRPGLIAHATLNYTHAEQTIDGGVSPGNRTPPLNGVLGLDYQLYPGLSLAPSVWLNGRQDRLDATDLADSRINPKGTGGFAVVNLAAYWQADSHWRLQVSAENLLDKHYREHGSGLDGRGVGATVQLQAAFH